MRDELVYSLWSADTSNLVERATEALTIIDKVFPIATFWDAGHSHKTGPEATFIMENDESIKHHGGKLTTLWEKTVAHVSGHDINPNELVVDSSAYSEEMELSVRVFFYDFEITIQTELEYEERALTQNFDQFLQLLREIGACPAIGSCWFRRHSAFAGDPAYLYEPKKPFAKLYDPLRYDEVIDEVRTVRESVRTILSPADIEHMLSDMDVQVEFISEERLLAILGNPKGKGGGAIIKKLERKINSLLKGNT